MPNIYVNRLKLPATLKDDTTPAPAPAETPKLTPIQLAAALQLTPDPVQSALLADDASRCIINCCRQWGKSTITAVKAVHQALTVPESLTLVLSPAARQSAEFLRKVRSFLRKLGHHTKGDGHNEISVLLPNHSRIVGLPGNEDTTRGFSGVSLLIVDEAARVDDALYHAIRPSIAASPDARIWLLSTPRGRQGFFYEIFTARANPDSQPGPGWKRVSVPAANCPRISPSLLAEERAAMTPQLFRQEYCCEFTDAGAAILSSELLDNALCAVPPLPVGIRGFSVFPEQDPAIYDGHPHFFIGLDLGLSVDHTAICVLERADVRCGDRRDPVYFKYLTERRFVIRYLERMPLQTPFPNVAYHVAGITRHPSLAGSRTLVIDSTGIGKPFCDLLRSEEPRANFCPVVITTGEHTGYVQGTQHVPRHELLTALQLALQKGILKISRDLPEAGLLLDELSSLRYNEGRIETAKSTQHDDLVFAAALAIWRATK